MPPRSCDFGNDSSGQSNRYLKVLQIVCWNKRPFQGWEFPLDAHLSLTPASSFLLCHSGQASFPTSPAVPQGALIEQTGSCHCSTYSLTGKALLTSLPMVLPPGGRAQAAITLSCPSARSTRPHSSLSPHSPSAFTTLRRPHILPVSAPSPQCLSVCPLGSVHGTRPSLLQTCCLFPLFRLGHGRQEE